VLFDGGLISVLPKRESVDAGHLMLIMPAFDI
jgi:hypothetical protein